MGRILFRQFYTTFVEQCFHVVVRKRAHTGLPRKWYEFSTNWIAGLSEEDRAFIHLCLRINSGTRIQVCTVSNVLTLCRKRESVWRLLKNSLLRIAA